MSFDRFVGLSYADKGRGEAVDCWGLLVRVYAELRGIALPSYAERYSTAADRNEIAELIGGQLSAWRQVAPGGEQAFDGVLLREGRVPRHVGLVTTPGRLLHVSEGFTSRIENYRTGALRHRVVGFFRHRGCE